MLPWKKKAGDAVTQDEILVELETDKVVLDVPAPSLGMLAEIVKKEGDIVHADELLAAIDTEDKASAAAPTQAAAPAPSPAPAPAPAPAASGKAADFDVIVIGSGPGRLHRGDPRSEARKKGRLRRGMDQPCRQAETRRHVPECRLHSVEGAARIVQAARESRAVFRRTRHHDGQPRGRCRQDGQAQVSHRREDHGRHRVPVPQKTRSPGSKATASSRARTAAISRSK